MSTDQCVSVLQSVYSSVHTLLEFSETLRFSDGRGVALLLRSDPPRLQRLISGLVVCSDTRVPTNPDSAQLATLPEVLALVLNHMKRKKKRNVLSFGYQYSDRQGDWDPFKFHGSLSQSAAFISTSDLWTRINQRLGTQVTRHLLQECSVFSTAPPACLVQVCGAPLYDLVPLRTWSGFFLVSSGGATKIGIQPGVGGYRKKRTKELTTKRKGTKFRMCKWRKRKEEGSTKKRKREEDKDDGHRDDERRDAKKTRLQNEFHSRDVEINIPDLIQSEKAESTSTSSTPKEGVSSWKPSDQAPPRPSHCSVRVLSMLYCGRGMKGFVLNRKLRIGGGVRRLQGADLVRMVFLQGGAVLSGAETKPHRLPKRFFGMVPIFSQLLRQHRKCPYTHFLRKKCAWFEGREDMLFLLSSHSSSYRVYLFVRECLLHVVPVQLWGSEANRLNFLSNVKHFLRLGKFERLSLAQVMWRMRVSDCTWLGHKKRHCPSEQRYREWILGQFLLWMIDSFVVGVVKAMFYVTESVGHKHALRFYRRDVWTKLQNMAFRDHLSKGQWEALSEQQVASLPKTTVTSRIRFIPKTTGMRPITRLAGSGAALQQFQGSVRDLQNVLGVCVRERPAMLGSTVWGRADIHRVLSFITPQNTQTHHPLYFVKVDVSGAYDSLPHTKLMEVVEEVLAPVQDQCFSLRHYAKVWRDPTHTIRKQFCAKADTLESLNMKGFAVEEQNNGRLHNSILVERCSMEVRGADVLQFFKQMLNSYIIQYDQKWFRQVRGVPQGSTVSTMLCNLCYGHMENSILKNITEKGGCLMRLVDDFLLITPRLSKALHFLRTLLAGVPDYGCEINPQKIAVNFPVSDDPFLPEVTELPLQCLFPWCGLLINTSTLSVHNDYSGYAGQSLRYSLTLGSAPSPAVFMRQKLLRILRLKCDAIFLDLHLNSVEVVYKNLYKIILLQALRFHVCVRSLPLGQDVTTNPSFFLKMIWRMCSTIHRSITLSNSVGDDHQVSAVVQYEAVELLCCLAFLVVLTRYRPSYSSLLPHLHQRKRRLFSQLRGLKLERVLQASTPRIPLDFTSIHT